MSSSRTAEQREFPWVQQARRQRLLMDHYSHEDPYIETIDSFRAELAELRDRSKVGWDDRRPDVAYEVLRQKIVKTVAERLRLVDREHRQSLPWAVFWVECDIHGEAAPCAIHGEEPRQWCEECEGQECETCHERKACDACQLRRWYLMRRPYQQFFRFPHTSLTFNCWGKPVGELVTPAGELEYVSPIPERSRTPGFSLLVDMNIVSFTAPGFDADERWGESFFEHGKFETGITAENWKDLEQLACGLVREGMALMRNQFREQLPSEFTSRTQGRDSESAALKLLCQYLLTRNYHVFEEADLESDSADLSVDQYDALLPDSTEPPSARQARELCNAMGIYWPKKPSTRRVSAP